MSWIKTKNDNKYYMSMPFGGTTELTLEGRYWVLWIDGEGMGMRTASLDTAKARARGWLLAELHTAIKEVNK